MSFDSVHPPFDGVEPLVDQPVGLLLGLIEFSLGFVGFLLGLIEFSLRLDEAVEPARQVQKFLGEQEGP